MNNLLFGVALSVFSLVSQAQEFRLASSDIQHGEQVKNMYVLNGSGCLGKNISPALAWSGEPSGTRSFAITMFDSDAPTGSGWWHRTLANIPKGVHHLKADAGNTDGEKIPVGSAQGRTDFGRPGYGGPCPPAGTHHYHFKVWALKVEKLPIDASSRGAMVGYMLNTNSIATAEMVPISTR